MSCFKSDVDIDKIQHSQSYDSQSSFHAMFDKAEMVWMEFDDMQDAGYD